MNMKLFRRKRHLDPMPVRIRKAWDLLLRSMSLLALPALFTPVPTAIWYFGLYKYDIHFHEKMEGIVTAAWIPVFGLLYVLFATVILTSVWGEYKSMRIAVKRHDVEAFVDLRDENMSPLVHTLMLVLSLSVLGAFMGLKYPTALDGFLVISATSYLFALTFFIIQEIDDPCAGFWYIKNMPKHWLEIDVRAWRDARNKKAFEETCELVKKMKKAHIVTTEPPAKAA